MTADLKEAFATAAVAFIDWERKNENVREWGHIYGASGELTYLPEPKVQFFGRDLPISTICERAKILTGPLPLLARAIFEVVDHYGSGDITETYAQAVEALQDCIECEFFAQESHPLSGPCTADRIRELERERLLSAANQAIAEQISGRRGPSRLFRLRPKEWPLILKKKSRGTA
ncbi:hypothetical protein [Microvirga lenta]|uniref:hypothetical protein n=1 Tax=Microvirga lenta TaxID=2881337 RepID=UPI001CFF7CE2|nr:hypothetical protein [Microvirga lenta]MCB5176774.1 hypothetical protein [Microvirga lenta]